MAAAPSDIARFYYAPESKRAMARGLAVLSALLLAWLLTNVVRGWDARTERGLAANYGSLVMCVAPLILLVVGVWIGWGHTRLDLGRLTFQRRPFGLPLPSRTRPLAEAHRLYVGFHRAPRVVATADAAPPPAPRPVWYVELQGQGFRIPLVHQRARRDEALAFAEHIAEAAGLPVVTAQASAAGDRS